MTSSSSPESSSSREYLPCPKFYLFYSGIPPPISSLALDLARHKFKIIIFSRNGPPFIKNITVSGLVILKVNKVKFLSVMLDDKLNGKEYLEYFLSKGSKVARIVLSLTDT